MRRPTPAARPAAGQPIRVALLGLGRWGGGRLLPALEVEKGYEVVRTAGRRPRPDPRHRTDLAGAILEPGLDAVVVALPPPLLAPASALARAAGLHVLCETPGVTWRGDVALLRQTAGAWRPVLAFTCPVRFAPLPPGPVYEHHSLWHLADLACRVLGPDPVLEAARPGRFRLRAADGRRAEFVMRPGTGPSHDPAPALKRFEEAVREGGGQLPGIEEVAAALRLRRRLFYAHRASKARALFSG